MYRILVIENDPVVRRAAESQLTSQGHVVRALESAEALLHLESEQFDVVLAAASKEVQLPARPTQTIPHLVYAAPALTPSAIEEALARARERASASEGFVDPTAAIAPEGAAGAPIGRSPAMQLLLSRIGALAASAAPVLLTGESGTGKDLLAREIVRVGARSKRPFVAVNCAAFPEALLEAELFGHERGAFTGAHRRREGRFQLAHGGTLFLDEINSLSLASQAKLLRVLQDGTFQPIGTNTTMEVDVRLITASNRDLKGLVAAGRFREDLFYRIKVLEILVPPLRNRAQDIPLLVRHFLSKYAKSSDEIPRLSPGAWAALLQHDFPGNVRELEHAIQHALVFSQGREIKAGDLPREIGGVGFESDPQSAKENIRPLAEAVREFELAYVARALELAGGSRTETAKRLGVSRKTLWQKMGQLAAITRAEETSSKRQGS